MATPRKMPVRAARPQPQGQYAPRPATDAGDSMPATWGKPAPPMLPHPDPNYLWGPRNSGRALVVEATDDSLSPRVARIKREYAAIRDKLHADAAAEAARRAAESERLHREGGYFPGGNGYVTPRPGAWTPAMQAEVDNFSYNNPRPSPTTLNRLPAAAPKRPSARERDGMPKGRGYTHEEVYGPGGQLDQQIAREQENERKRVEMQAGIDKLKASRPKSPRAPGPSQLQLGLQMLSAAQQAQMGQYGPPAAPAVPRSGGWPATRPTPSPAAGVVARPVPLPVGDIEVSGGPGPVAMNPSQAGQAPQPIRGVPAQPQTPATSKWPVGQQQSPASLPAANRPGMAYYQDPNTGVVYEVAAGSTSQNTGIGPLGAMRNAYADIVGNQRPVSGTTEVSPSMQVSPQRGQMNAPASEQMMREGGYLPVDRAALDSARDKYRQRKMTNAQREAERRRALLEAEMTQGLYGVAPVIR